MDPLGYKKALPGLGSTSAVSVAGLKTRNMGGVVGEGSSGRDFQKCATSAPGTEAQCTNTCMYMYMYVCIHICMYLYIHTSYVGTHMYICICRCTIYIYKYVHLFLCVYIYIHMFKE